MVVVIVLLVIVVVAALVVVFLQGKKGAAAANERIDGALASLEVQRKDKATCLGLASSADKPVRGVGVLALTPTEIAFFQLVPDREVRIPRAAITAVDAADEVLGQRQPNPVLRIAWADGDTTDEVGFKTGDVAGWVAALA